ncbi:DapH/DapD/GlmU-related protein [Azonexus sp.]|uniref:acyltransferase n=1 Tax=Azonexus sp. TaxID=1872668 RepID=UPI0035B34785
MFNKIFAALNYFFDLAVFFSKGGVYSARRKGVKVGNRCRIYIHSFGTEPFLITIGNSVTITSGVRILTHDGSTGLILNKNGSRYQYYAPVTIGDNVFVGVNSIIMPGVKIGSNVIIGAGSVITKDVMENSVVVGNPARYICSFNDYKEKVIAGFANDDDLVCFNRYEDRVRKSIEIFDAKRKNRYG